MPNYIPRIADAITILAGVAVLVLLVIHVSGDAPIDPTETLGRLESEIVGRRINGAELAPSRTLVMALRSDCVFCQESMPFYRRLLERDRAGVRIVVAAPRDDTGIGDYLESEGTKPDSIVFVEPDALPVSGTPTLLYVDDEGLITHAWIGLLNAAREREVFDALW